MNTLSPPQTTPEPRTWPRIALTLLMLVGVGICVYLTWHHENELYGDASVELGNCPQTETINCEAVNTSAYSEAFGVPIALFGIPAYLLVLLLMVAMRRVSNALAIAFGIGLLATGYSGFLLWASMVKVGFLCAWCMRLYGINLAIPLLAWLAARQSPLTLGRTAVGELLTFGAGTRRAGLAFAAMLAISIGVQQTYRASLQRSLPAAAPADVPRVVEVTAPKSAAPAPAPETGAAGEAGEAPVAAPTNPLAFRLPAKVEQIRADDKGKVSRAPFDLQSKIGQGRPVVLAFWHPGFGGSEGAVSELARFVAREGAKLETYAIVGRRGDKKIGHLYEMYAMMPDVDPERMPLLVDEEFALSRAMGTTQVPTYVAFDGDGRIVLPKASGLTQEVFEAGGRRLTVSVILQRLATGEPVPAVKRVLQYYPGQRRLGTCAPKFTLPDFRGGAPKVFDPDELRRPTLMMFWSSTCSHCRREIPPLLEWHRRHPDAVDIVTITRIRPPQPGKPDHRDITHKYLKGTDIPWTVYEDVDGAVSDLFRVVSTPTTYIIAPNGEVVSAWFYVNRDVDAAMNKALDATKAATGECEPIGLAPRPVVDFEFAPADAPVGAKPVALANALKRPTLVHFWATWCEPCKKELPSLLKFAEGLDKAGGDLLLISVEDDDAKARIEAYADKSGLPLRSGRAPKGGFADEIDIAYSVPRTFLVAPDGELLGTKYGEQNWHDSDLGNKIRGRLLNPGR